jgi:hypothetical protein
LVVAVLTGLAGGLAAGFLTGVDAVVVDFCCAAGSAAKAQLDKLNEINTVMKLRMIISC